jgi:hypothetical protein
MVSPIPLRTIIPRPSPDSPPEDPEETPGSNALAELLGLGQGARPSVLPQYESVGAETPVRPLLPDGTTDRRAIGDVKKDVLAKLAAAKRSQNAPLRTQPWVSPELLLREGAPPDPRLTAQMVAQLGPGGEGSPIAEALDVQTKFFELLESSGLPFMAFSEGMAAIMQPTQYTLDPTDKFPTDRPLLQEGSPRDPAGALELLGVGERDDFQGGIRDTMSRKAIHDFLLGKGDLSVKELAGLLRENFQTRSGLEQFFLSIVLDPLWLIPPLKLAKMPATAGRLGLLALRSSTAKSRQLVVAGREVAETAAQRGRSLFDPNRILGRQPKYDPVALRPITPTTREVAQEAPEVLRLQSGWPEVLRGELLPSAKAVVPKGSELEMIEDMWRVGKEPSPRDWPDTLLKMQENYDDMYIGLRQMQTRAGIPQTGGEKDLITFLTRAPGAANSGAARYLLALEEIKRAAPTADINDISSFIFAQHAKEVFGAKGPKRVLGKFTSADQMDASLVTMSEKLGEEGMAEVERAARIVQRIYKEERQRMADVGIFTQEFVDDMAVKYPWYNPINYLEYSDQQAMKGKSVKPFSVVDNGIIALSEKGGEGTVLMPMEVLFDTLVRNEARIVRNETAKAVVMVAQADPQTVVQKVKLSRPVATIGKGEDVATVWRPTHQDIPGTVSFFKDGKRQVYSVPEWMDRELNMYIDMSKSPISQFAAAVNGISRAAFTSQNPLFIATNVMNDTLTAFVTRGILPNQTAMTLIRSLRGLERDPIMQAFRLSGGYQQRFFGKNANQALESVMRSGGLPITSAAAWKQALRKTGGIIPAVGEAGEQAPRMALFRREIEKNLPGWKHMSAEEIARTPQARKAAADAVELTINFARGGYVIKHANAFLLFLNAAMEGTKLPFRMMAHNANARRRMAGVAAGYTGLMAYNLSYPEYHDIPNWQRWGSVIVMLPSKEKDIRGNNKPNYFTVIPRTREWSMVLAPIAYTMERFWADNPTDLVTFARTLLPQLSPIDDIPLPVVVEALIGQATNYDIFRGRPVVPTELQGLPSDEQVTPWTSRTLQEVGEGVGVAPVRIEHAFDSILGGAGQTATSVTDYILNWLMPPEKNPRIQALLNEYEEQDSPLARDRFYFALQTQDRKDLDKALKQPEIEIPIYGAFKRRLFPGRGGQSFVTKKEIAERETGLSAAETREAGRAIRGLGELHHTEQQNDDADLKKGIEEEGGISHKTWRDRRSDRGTRYQGTLDTLGIQFPRAAQVAADPEAGKKYFDLIAQAAHGVPDRRTRAEILAAGWYSIVLDEREDGEKDFFTFFALRDEYEQSLSKDDLSLLRDKIESRLTPTEIEYQRDHRAMRPYFDLTRNVMEAYGALDIYARYLQLPRKNRASFLAQERNWDLGAALSLLSGAEDEGTWKDKTTGKTVGSRLGFRAENPAIDTLLLKWDYTGDLLDFLDTSLSEENIRLEKEGAFTVEP